MRSCLMPVGDVGDAEVTTIEGLSADSSHPVQQAWIESDVPQCGYCQSGQIMAAVGAARREPEADRRRHRPAAHQHLPLRHLSADPRGDPSRRRDRQGVSGAEDGHDDHRSIRRSRAASSSSARRPPPAAWCSASACRGGAGATEIAAQPWTSPLDGGAEVNAWLVIDPDDSVTIRVAQSEMGQGVFTSLPMIVAEELECDWAQGARRIRLGQPQPPRGQRLSAHGDRRQRRRCGARASTCSRPAPARARG